MNSLVEHIVQRLELIPEKTLRQILALVTKCSESPDFSLALIGKVHPTTKLSSGPQSERSEETLFAAPTTCYLADANFDRLYSYPHRFVL